MPTPFVTRLVEIAEEQRTLFRSFTETDPTLCNAIQQWIVDVGLPVIPCTDPWSAVFISWCMKQAGATKAEFRFSNRHSVFVHRAIKNADNGVGVFRAFPIDAEPPTEGDLIQNNFKPNTFDFAHARANASYRSHSKIVVKVREDRTGRKVADCIGGNESNSVGRSTVRLDDNGLIRQRRVEPYICVVKNLK